MGDQAGDGTVGIFHLGNEFVRFLGQKYPGVTDLPAGFRIERRAVEYDFRLDPGRKLFHQHGVAQQGQHGAVLLLGLGVALEDNRPLFKYVRVGRREDGLGATLPACTGAFALPGHRLVKASPVQP